MIKFLNLGTLKPKQTLNLETLKPKQTKPKQTLDLNLARNPKK